MTLTRPTNAPAIYSQDGIEPTVYARYYVPGHVAVWFVTEYDPERDEIFGWAELIPGGGELGYTSISEMEATGLVVFDTEWQETKLRDAIADRAEFLKEMSA